MFKLRDWIPLDKIEWYWLSRNPNAIHLLEQNLDKIDWKALSFNPGIFEYDYEAMKKTRDPIKNELMIERFHPKHIHQFSSWGF